MSNIESFVKERITKNFLSINAEECLATMKKYEGIYPDTSEMKLFFYYVLNLVGGILAKVDIDYAEMYGNLKVRGKKDITFFEFDFEEDYLDWQKIRLELYPSITNNADLRLLNYAELSTMNMISDIYTKCKYELISKDGTVTYFEKTGYGTDQDKQSFIKFLGTKFKEGYSFRPIKSVN